MSTHGKAMAKYGQRFGIWNQSPVTQNKTGHARTLPITTSNRPHPKLWSNEGDTVSRSLPGSGTTGAGADIGRRLKAIGNGEVL